ncbi:MAG: filamentous hemagglutinin family outer membrane protein, partial [Verrucomicrobiales bacterium]|nr:filamentous hemagglutinin family outer membrane protein [Verrucomicrobiales bacterium]
AIYNYGYYAGSQGTFVNQSNAVFNLIADGPVFAQDYNRSYFTNLAGGLIVKTIGAGTNVLARFGFENFGEIRANTGSIQFPELLDLNTGSKITGAGTVLFSGSVNMNAPLSNSANIVLDNGTLTGAVSTNGTALSSYSGTGSFNWTGGSMAGIFLLSPGNAINVNGGNIKTFNGGTVFDNYGTVNWSGPGTIYNYAYYAGTQATINNRSNSVFNLLTDGKVFSHDYSPSFFNNFPGATLIKVNGNGTNFIDSFTVENVGEIRAQSGNIQFNETLDLFSGSQLTGPGAIRFAGNVTLNGVTTGSAASINFDTGSLTGINGGTYAGSAPFNWYAGTFNGALTIAAGSTLNVTGTTDKTMAPGAILNNAGMINWSGPGRIYNEGYGTGTQAKIMNMPNANFNLLTDGEVFFNQYNPSTFMNQAGAHFSKLGGTGTNYIHAFTMYNFGEVRAQTGAIQFTENLDIAGGTFTGAGNVQSLGTTTLHGGMDVNGTTFKLINGTFTGDTASTANISSENGGVFEWQSGALLGTLRLNAGSTINVSGSLRKDFGANAIFNNAGTMTLSSGNIYNYNYSGQQATLNNLAGGLIDSTGDANFTSDYSPSIINNNAGATFRKSAATTMTSVWIFNNNGTIDLRDGTFVNNALSFGTNGILNVSLTSTNTNAHLTQNGAFTFAGSLNLIGNGVPLTNGLSFTLANYNSATGAFSPLTLPPLPQGSKWKLTYGSTTLTAAVVPATALSSPTKDGHGGFQLSLNGEPASAAVLQTSLDLNAWKSVATNAPFTGTFDFSDAPSANETNKFYRIIITP